MNVHPTASPATSTHIFDEIVCLKLDTGWRYIENGEQAVDCLREDFVDQTEPSWHRAYTTCAAFVAGQGGRQEHLHRGGDGRRDSVRGCKRV